MSPDDLRHKLNIENLIYHARQEKMMATGKYCKMSGGWVALDHDCQGCRMCENTNTENC